MPSTSPEPDIPTKKKYHRLYEDVSNDFSSPPSPPKRTPAKPKSQRKAKTAAPQKRSYQMKDDAAAETDAEAPEGPAAVELPKKKYLQLYEDVSDNFSSPPSPKPQHKRAPLKTKSKGKSKSVAKPKHAPRAVKTMNALREESNVDPAVLDGPAVDYFSVEHPVSPVPTQIGKVSQSRSRTRIHCGSAVTKYKYDEHDTAIVDCAASDGDNSHLDTDILVDDRGNTIVDSATSDGDNSCLETNVPVDGRDNAIVDSAANDDDSIHLETDDPLDGCGDPNLSGITPPLPMNLIEPMRRGHETGYHVITAGTAIGISVIRGIAESHLNCERASMVTFQTWLQAEAYYTASFEANSIRICDPRPVQTPIHSPVHKKQKLGKGSSLTCPKVLTQPHFALAGSLSHTGLDHEISAAAHHFLVPQANSTPTPSPQVFIPHPHRIIFEDSSDDSMAATTGITNMEENS